MHVNNRPGCAVARRWLAWIGCFFLVGGAIIVHWAFIAAIPDPIFQPDSGSYVQPVIYWLYGKSVVFNAVRTPVYSIFLYFILKISPHFTAVLIVQHLLALLTGAMAAFVYYRYFKTSYLAAGLIFFLSSALPWPAVYAHMILTENLYTFLAVLALLLMLWSHEKNEKVLWCATGATIAIAVLTRPVGRSLLAVLILASLWEIQQNRRWRSVYGIGTVMGILFSFSLWNYAAHGFFGLDQMGNIALYCNSAKYLDPATIKDAQVKAILEPFYKQHPEKLNDGQWIFAEGPCAALAKHYAPVPMNAILGRLAASAIENHPFQFLRDRLRNAVNFLAFAQTPLYFIIPETSHFVYLGLYMYEEMTRSVPQAWKLLHYGSREMHAYFSGLTFVPTGRPSGHLPLLPRSSAPPIYHYENVLKLWRPLAGLIRHLGALPIIAMVSILILYSSQQLRYPTTLLTLALGLHVLVSTLAAWQDSRFVVPVLPLYWLLAIAGIDYAGRVVKRFSIRKSPLL